MAFFSGFMIRDDKFYAKVFHDTDYLLIDMNTGEEYTAKDDFDLLDEESTRTLRGGIFAYIYSDYLYQVGLALTKQQYRLAKMLHSAVCNYIEQEYFGYESLVESLSIDFSVTVFAGTCRIVDHSNPKKELVKAWKNACDWIS